MKKWIFVAAVMVLAGFLLSACQKKPSNEDNFISGCNKVLKQRLKSQSSFVMTDYVIEKEEIPYGDVAQLREELSELIRQSDADPDNAELEYEATLKALEIANVQHGEPPKINYNAYITYEAANSYGTMLTDVAHCEGRWSESRTDYLNESDLKVDGMTPLEWIGNLGGIEPASRD